MEVTYMTPRLDYKSQHGFHWVSLETAQTRYEEAQACRKGHVLAFQPTVPTDRQHQVLDMQINTSPGDSCPQPQVTPAFKRSQIVQRHIIPSTPLMNS